MEARHLELLRELADRGSVSAVAAAGHRTPSAVSQQLRTAERELRVKLVEPAGRGIRLTVAGEVLARAAVDVATALAAAESELDRLRTEPAGCVTITALPSAGEALLPSLFTELAGGPISIDLDDADVSEDAFAALAADRDIVIGHSFTAPVPVGAEGLVCRELATEPIDVALPEDHPLAGRAHLTARDVAEADWIGVPIGYPFDTVRLTVENLTGVPVRVRQRLRDNQLNAALVAAGHGIALLPRYTTRPRPGMVLTPLRGAGAVRRIVALSRPDRAQRAAVRSVLDSLAGIGAGLAGPG